MPFQGGRSSTAASPSMPAPQTALACRPCSPGCVLTRADNGGDSSACRKQEGAGCDRGLPPFGILQLSSTAHTSLVLQVLGEPGKGKVLVVDGGASLRCALLGDQIAAMAAKNGWEVSVRVASVAVSWRPLCPCRARPVALRRQESCIACPAHAALRRMMPTPNPRINAVTPISTQSYHAPTPPLSTRCRAS